MPVRAGPAPSGQGTAWGSDDEDNAASAPSATRQAQWQQRGPAEPASTSGRLGQTAPPAGRARAAAVQQQLRGRLTASIAKDSVESDVPSLQAVVLGCIARHLAAFVQEAGEYLAWLPPQAKQALLAVARRRGLLVPDRRSNGASCAALTALVDESWRALDLSGCSRLTDAVLLEAAERLPELRVVDLSGCGGLSARAYKRLAKTCPQLQVLRVGGSQHCNDALSAALPRLLPRVAPLPAKAGDASNTGGDAAAASWEDAADEVAALAQEPGRLHELQAIVWPDAPAAALALIASQCPKVAVNPKLRRNLHTGAPPPRELDPAVPLDGTLMRLVGLQALEGVAADGAVGQGEGAEVEHISLRFRTAYIEQAAKRQAREQQRWQQEQRRQWRMSAALRATERWLDEA